MTEHNPLDEVFDALFEGAAMVSTVRAFRALDIQKTLGHELINRGVLERVKIGRASRITVESIKTVAKNGVPAAIASPSSPPSPRLRRGN